MKSKFPMRNDDSTNSLNVSLMVHPIKKAGSKAIKFLEPVFYELLFLLVS
jgi:hypothetical protein